MRMMSTLWLAARRGAARRRARRDDVGRGGFDNVGDGAAPVARRRRVRCPCRPGPSSIAADAAVGGRETGVTRDVSHVVGCLALPRGR